MRSTRFLFPFFLSGSEGCSQGANQLWYLAMTFNVQHSSWGLVKCCWMQINTDPQIQKSCCKKDNTKKTTSYLQLFRKPRISGPATVHYLPVLKQQLNYTYLTAALCPFSSFKVLQLLCLCITRDRQSRTSTTCKTGSLRHVLPTNSWEHEFLQRLCLMVCIWPYQRSLGWGGKGKRCLNSTVITCAKACAATEPWHRH